MFNINNIYKIFFPADTSLNNESLKSNPSPNKSVYSIEVQKYHRLIGQVLALTGYAIQLKTSDQGSIYISKKKFLKLISKDQQKQNDILLKIKQSARFFITINESDFVNELINSQHLLLIEKLKLFDDDKIDKIKNLEYSYLILDDTCHLLKKLTADFHAIDDKKRNYYLEKLKSNIEAISHYSNDDLLKDLSHFILQDFDESHVKNDQLIKLNRFIKDFEKLKEHNENNYSNSLNEIEDALKKLIHYPHLILFLNLDHFATISKLHEDFFNLDKMISHIYKNEHLSKKFIILNEEHKQLTEQLIHSPSIDMQVISDYLKKENQLIKLIDHSKEYLINKHSKPDDLYSANAKIIDDVIARANCILSKLSPDQLNSLENEFNPDEGKYRAMGGIIKNFKKMIQ